MVLTSKDGCLPIAIVYGYRGIELAVLFAMLGTPASIYSYIMAVETNIDSELAGQLVISTTFFGIFTIFLFLYLLRYLMLI